jgi:hypothetical protein
MEAFDVDLVERYAYKASRKGFFPEWQELTSSIYHANEDLKYDDAAAKAYQQLKLQGSD